MPPALAGAFLCAEALDVRDAEPVRCPGPGRAPCREQRRRRCGQAAARRRGRGRNRAGGRWRPPPCRRRPLFPMVSCPSHSAPFKNTPRGAEPLDWGCALSHPALNPFGALHNLDNARELRQHAVAHQLEDAHNDSRFRVQAAFLSGCFFNFFDALVDLRLSALPNPADFARAARFAAYCSATIG